MVYFEKSQPAPSCLAVEKAKKSGTYRCEGVATTLQADFKNKCYLCEQKGPTSINIEHFIPHRDDIHLKFDWSNLFFSCYHCNNTKGSQQIFDQILNCTNSSDQVDISLKYEFQATPKEQVMISALADSNKAKNSAQLLMNIYNGNTEIKQLESGNIRALLRQEIRRFQDFLLEYESLPHDDQRKPQKRIKIIRQLQNDSAFTAFKRWIILDNQKLSNEFISEF